MSEQQTKRFEDMDPAEKRVAIARDLIEHVKAGRVRARESVWLGTTDGTMFKADDDRQLDAVLKSMLSCECCQVGGLLYATVCRANAVKVSEVIGVSQDRYLDFSDFDGYLRTYFSDGQLTLMEIVFEGGRGAWDECDLDDAGVDESDDVYDSACAFCRRHSDPTDRMVAICENIIKNQGDFVL